MSATVDKSARLARTCGGMLLLTIVLLGLALTGCRVDTEKKESYSHLTPEEAKALVNKYLREKSEREEFKSTLDLSQEKNPWTVMKTVYDAPPDYKTVYRGIGEHLAIAETFMANTNEQSKATGVRIVTELLTIANEVAYDPWLGARITDGYLAPLLGTLPENPKRGLSAEQAFHLASRAYRLAEEDDKVIEVNKNFLAKFGDSPRADDIRRRLAWMLQRQGKDKEAQTYLSQIKTKGNGPKKN